MSSFASLVRQTFSYSVCGALALFAAAQAHAIPFVPDIYSDVFEVVNDDTGRYMWLSVEEFDSVMARAGRGWRRTGYRFNYHSFQGNGGNITAPTGPVPGRVAVCHFYAPQTDAHFFTANPYECDGLRDAPESGWRYIGASFTSAMPSTVGGTCPSGTQAIYRLYRDGGRSYRYVFDADLHARMIREGWTEDGLAFCEDSVARDAETDVVELVNDNTGRYVWLRGAELVAVLQGSAGPGWRRTGYAFGYFGSGIPSVGSFYPPNYTSVCRFYAPQTNSHFFTSSIVECDGLRAVPSSGWRYEGIAFSSTIPKDGACPAGTTALYRLYSDGGLRYRYVFDAFLQIRMINDGWTYDGLAFCEEFVFRDVGS